MTTFYRWLYNLGLNPVEEVFNSNANLNADDSHKRTSNGARYLSKARLVQSGYKFVDSSDANNIYLWIAGDSPRDMKQIKSNFDTFIT